jgi:site-specific recombinase XerD
MSDRNDVQTTMADADDVQKSLDQMKIFMELRGLRPNTVYTFALCARGFLAHAGKAPTAIKAADVESFLLDLTRKGRSPKTRNVNLSAVRCLLFATLGEDSRVVTAGIPNARVRRRRPEILSGTEVERLLAAMRRCRSCPGGAPKRRRRRVRKSRAASVATTTVPVLWPGESPAAPQLHPPAFALDDVPPASNVSGPG